MREQFGTTADSTNSFRLNKSSCAIDHHSQEQSHLKMNLDSQLELASQSGVTGQSVAEMGCVALCCVVL